MGLFDFFKKKATEEQPQTEEQQEGVLELDGVEVETDAQEADIVLDVEDGQDMNRAVHAVMDEEEIQIDRAGEDILYREEAEEAPAEAEIEITFEDADGEEILTAEDAAEAEAVLDELTEIAGEILAEKPLAEDEVIVATEDGEIFTADNDADGRAFVEELADEVAEELNQEETAEEAQKTPAEESAEEEKPAKMGFFAKLRTSLAVWMAFWARLRRLTRICLRNWKKHLSWRIWACRQQWISWKTCEKGLRESMRPTLR